MDTSSNNTTVNNGRPLDVAPNKNDSPDSGLESVVKVKQNIDPGLEARVPLSPFMVDYFSRVLSPIPIAKGTWTTSQEEKTELINLMVSPIAPYLDYSPVPYFVHEALKWNSYRSSFKLRIVFFAGSMYRGVVTVQRVFNKATTIGDAVNETTFAIDGGNEVYEHIVRPTTNMNYKFTLPNLIGDPHTDFDFFDIYYERLIVKVNTKLNVSSSMYPTSVPFVVLLEPLSDLTFATRRNNLVSYAPVVQATVEDKDKNKVKVKRSFIQHVSHFIKK